VVHVVLFFDGNKLVLRRGGPKQGPVCLHKGCVHRRRILAKFANVISLFTWRGHRQSYFAQINIDELSISKEIDHRSSCRGQFNDITIDCLTGEVLEL